MSKFAQEILKNRQEFLGYLQKDLNQTENVIEKTNEIISELNETINVVKTLSTKVEHETLIPLGKKIYVNGIIKHTGEFFIDQQAFPNAFSTHETLDNTIKLLEHRIAKQKEILEKGENMHQQLSERMKLLEIKEDQDQIVSDRGVAVKMGEFYEILEYEE